MARAPKKKTTATKRPTKAAKKRSAQPRGTKPTKSAKSAKKATKRPARKSATRVQTTKGRGRAPAGKPPVGKAAEGLPLFENETPVETVVGVDVGSAVSTEKRHPTVPAVEKTPEGAPRRPRKNKKSYQTAQTIAQRQREISISEFFAKNRHLLGFDSLPKALLTAVKEAVDNSLDACEEAGLLPDLLVEIREIGEQRYHLLIADSGPGIVKSQVPKIFGKLLYGSKFHVLKQARGQQGIGISAAVMYSQLTTGKPVKVTTRTSSSQKASVFELQIQTKTNSPVIVSECSEDWDRPHGTQVEMELLASFKKGQRSVDAYLHQVAMANPHAEIVYRPPRDPEIVYHRLSNELPYEANAIRPHPHGVELGVLLDMLKVTKARNVKGFLEREFSRVSAKGSLDILKAAGIAPSTSPKRVNREQGDRLIRSFARAKIMKPPTDCLSPIGEELLLKSVEKENDPAFLTAVTRPPAVYRGNPFQIEAAIAYGGPALSDDDTVKLRRFANRAPLVYQQSACAITHSVVNTAWKGYGVAQARGGLPTGSMLLVVHIASAWVPFTSESKEAIAHYPEIIKEIKLALQECGRRLARFIRKGAREKEEAKKRSYIEQYIPHIGAALREILALSEREEQRVVAKLKTTLEKSRKL